MSHAIDISNSRANMAYAEGSATPWHGLGFTVRGDASIEEWQAAAGLNFTVRKGELLFRAHDGVLRIANGNLNRAVLYRDDTMQPLSVMSENRYQIHQPADILGFIADVSHATGWPVETAGSLYAGRKIWALLKLPESYELLGGDRVEGYLLAATSFDGSTGSEFRFVATRVVCNNTLTMALGENAKHRVVVYHDSKIDPSRVRGDLQIADSVWSGFIETAKRLASIQLTRDKAIDILRKVYGEPKPEHCDGAAITLSRDDYIAEMEVPRRVLSLYDGAGIGANLASSLGTGWGLVNAVTQDVDHFGSNRNTRLNSAWFGPGAGRKSSVVDAVLELA